MNLKLFLNTLLALPWCLGAYRQMFSDTAAAKRGRVFLKHHYHSRLTPNPLLTHQLEVDKVQSEHHVSKHILLYSDSSENSSIPQLLPCPEPVSSHVQNESLLFICPKPNIYILDKRKSSRLKRVLTTHTIIRESTSILQKKRFNC